MDIMYYENSKPDYFVRSFFCFVIAVVLFGVFVLIDYGLGFVKKEKVEILDMAFSGGQSASTFGYSFNQNGGVSPVYANSNTSDEWILIVTNGVDIDKITLSSKHYYAHKKGDKVVAVYRVGQWTNWIYGTDIE